MTGPKRAARRSPCGDELVFDGERLVIRAALPIEGLEASRYRNPVLRVDGERFVLVDVAGTKERPLYTLTVEHESLYAPAGEVIFYDGERHLERRHERRRLALAWLLWIPTVPLLPLIGLLPADVKEKLVRVGVNPGRATHASLAVELLLLGLGTIVYVASGGFFMSIGHALLGALLLGLAADIAYRVTAGAP